MWMFPQRNSDLPIRLLLWRFHDRFTVVGTGSITVVLLLLLLFFGNVLPNVMFVAVYIQPLGTRNKSLVLF